MRFVVKIFERGANPRQRAGVRWYPVRAGMNVRKRKIGGKMFISRNYVAKTGTLILKTLEDGFLTTSVRYGKGTPLFKKGIRRMVVTDYGNKKGFDFFNKKGVSFTEEEFIKGNGNDFSKMISEFLSSL